MESTQHKTWEEMANRKAGARTSAKIRQVIQELHEKLAKFSAPNFPLSFFQNLKPPQ